MMACKLVRIASTVMPRKPSFPPSSRTSVSIFRLSSQSIRRRPPAVVSPLTPALTTVKFQPAASILFCSKAGKASLGSSPKPAAKLSPRTTTVLRDSAAAESEARAVGGVAHAAKVMARKVASDRTKLNVAVERFIRQNQHEDALGVNAVIGALRHSLDI